MCIVYGLAHHLDYVYLMMNTSHVQPSSLFPPHYSYTFYLMLCIVYGLAHLDYVYLREKTKPCPTPLSEGCELAVWEVYV